MGTHCQRRTGCIWKVLSREVTQNLTRFLRHLGCYVENCQREKGGGGMEGHRELTLEVTVVQVR